MGTPPVSAGAATSTQTGTPQSAVTDGMSPGLASAYQDALAVADGVSQDGAPVQPSAPGAESNPETSPAPVGGLTEDANGIPNFEFDLSEGDFTDPARYARVKAHEAGIQAWAAKQHAKVQSALQDAQKASEAVEISSRFDQMMSSPQGTQMLIEKLTAHLGALTANPASGPAAASATPTPTGKPVGDGSDAFADDPFGIQAMIEKGVNERLSELQPVLDQVRHEQQVKAWQKDIEDYWLPQVSASLASAHPGVTVTAAEIDAAVKAYPGLFTGQTQGELVNGLVNALKLAHMDRFVTRTTALVTPVPPMPGSNGSPVGIPNLDKTNSTFEERSATYLQQALQQAGATF